MSAAPAARRIRVSLVIADLERAGAETQLVHLASTLDRAAFEARIVLIKSRNDFTDELRAAGIPVTALGRRGPADLHLLARLRGSGERRTFGP